MAEGWVTMFDQLFYYGTCIITLWAAAIFTAGIVISHIPVEGDEDDVQD